MHVPLILYQPLSHPSELGKGPLMHVLSMFNPQQSPPSKLQSMLFNSTSQVPSPMRDSSAGQSARNISESTISISLTGLYTPTPISRENGASYDPQYGTSKLLHCPVIVLNLLSALQVGASPLQILDIRVTSAVPSSLFSTRACLAKAF